MTSQRNSGLDASTQNMLCCITTCTLSDKGRVFGNKPYMEELLMV
jgi:hypothetical protein